ncbi:hypothetical protein [Achromobacter ruhlandii]|uniref:hypothetical protein n=1 Tax=Achromobacter ruhlandii TaxID=72557 RepID=UPI001EEE7DE0|nr:hypothetical protein [Achromobacter ruhlandii]
MKLTLAALALLAALLLLEVAVACAYGNDDDAREHACRCDAQANAPRAAGPWSFSNRFSLLTLPRLTVPFVHDGADCACWR